jgi:hypothetical protein
MGPLEIKKILEVIDLKSCRGNPHVLNKFFVPKFLAAGTPGSRASSNIFQDISSKICRRRPHGPKTFSGLTFLGWAS